MQPKINLRSFKSTPDSLKQRLKAFEMKRWLGAPEWLCILQVIHHPLTRWDEAHGGNDQQNGGLHGCCQRALRKVVTSCFGVAEYAPLSAAIPNNGTTLRLFRKMIESEFANSQSEERDAM